MQVMVHQFGHMLGLAHTNRITSAMLPFYTDWVNILFRVLKYFWVPSNIFRYQKQNLVPTRWTWTSHSTQEQPLPTWRGHL